MFQTGDANYTFKVTAIEATTLGGGAVAGAKIGGGIGGTFIVNKFAKDITKVCD